MKLVRLSCLTSLFFCTAAFASSPVCPAVGNDSLGCQLIITVTAVSPTGVATAFSVAQPGTNQGPYDGNDDTLLGIVNNSGATLNSVLLTASTDIFGFDGDGACTYIACAGTTDPSGYAPAGVTFTGINASATSGTVVFGSGLANGASTWFSLEEALTPTTITNGTPEPASVLLASLALPVLAVIRRRRAAK